MNEVVWLNENRRFAFLERRDAFVSLVYWYEGDERITLIVENDDYDLWEERAFEYDTDDRSEVRGMPEE